MEVGGVPLRKGQLIFLFLASALRDPAAFDRPDQFDIHRDLSQSIAFGSGAHFCGGSALARLELNIAVGTLIKRYPNIKLLSEPEFEAHPLLRAMTKLEVSL